MMQNLLIYKKMQFGIIDKTKMHFFILYLKTFIKFLIIFCPTQCIYIQW